MEQIERGNTVETEGLGSGPGGSPVNYRQLAADLELLQVCACRRRGRHVT